ncbi:MarR family transcriptional regulator [Micromonospora palythoicola]|uniref:MarR family transcriptional regulator n=1 Tax=Micromonospora palythoicola TaxID=3120507 RepID=UPI002FCE2DB6
MIDSTTNASTLERVLTALAERGPATAASIAASVGIAYPTTTPKLRELEGAGYAERIRTEQRTTLWQVTDTGATAAAAVAGGSRIPTPPAPPPDDDPAADEPPPRDGGPPEQDPQPKTAAPVEDHQPADQHTDDTTAAHDLTSMPPQQAAVPVVTVEQTDEQQAEPGSDAPPARDSRPASPPEGAAASSDAGKDQPGDDPGPDDRASASEAASPVHVAQPPPGQADQSADSRPQRGGRRTSARPRRRKGELRDQVQQLLRRHPDTAYKIAEICKLINQAHDGDNVNKASAGAVANALDKLVIAGTVTRLDTTVATYQAA